MKKLIRNAMVLATLLLPLAASAQKTECLILTQSDGTVSRFALAKSPEMSFNNEVLTVSCNGSTLTTSMEGLTANFGEAEPTAIRSLLADKDARPVMAFGLVSFEGLKAGASVVVYSADGKTVAETTADSQGRARADLRSLQKGVYMLRTPGHSYKIKK